MLTNGKIIHRLARPSAAAELRQCRYEIGVDTYSGTRGSRSLPRRFSWLQRVSWNPCTADRRPERTPITMSAHDQVRNAHGCVVKMTASNIEGRVDWAILGGARPDGLQLPRGREMADTFLPPLTKYGSPHAY